MPEEAQVFKSDATQWIHHHNAYDKEEVKVLLFESTQENVLKEITKEDNPNMLHVLACHYNWDDGFEIPRAILDNSCCELATALMMFYLADGETYLTEKSGNPKLPAWSEFIEKLYSDIKAGKYRTGDITFSVPLTKIQLYKLSKSIDEQEQIFITDIERKQH